MREPTTFLFLLRIFLFLFNMFAINKCLSFKLYFQLLNTSYLAFTLFRLGYLSLEKFIKNLFTKIFHEKNISVKSFESSHTNEEA